MLGEKLETLINLPDSVNFAPFVRCAQGDQRPEPPAESKRPPSHKRQEPVRGSPGLQAYKRAWKVTGVLFTMASHTIHSMFKGVAEYFMPVLQHSVFAEVRVRAPPPLPQSDGSGLARSNLSIR